MVPAGRKHNWARLKTEDPSQYGKGTREVNLLTSSLTKKTYSGYDQWKERKTPYSFRDAQGTKYYGRPLRSALDAERKFCMTKLPKSYTKEVERAVKHYWVTLDNQSKKNKKGKSDQGRRSAVTGGKQMDGFCNLIHWVLKQNGIPDASIFIKKGKLELPGYYRSTKEWDVLVVHDNKLLAALEFKSHRGPSFGNNLNNRVEEALGNATDLWTAYREGAFGGADPRPWLGWCMLLEDCAASQRTVKVKEPHFKVLPEFSKASTVGRYSLLAKRLMLEKLYDRTSLILSTASGGKLGKYTEPEQELTAKKFFLSLAGHVHTYVQGS